MKRRLCRISTPDISDIPASRTFMSNSRHLKAPAEIIADLWCIGIKKAKENLEETTQRDIRSDILPLSRRYRADRVYSLKIINARFATYNFFSYIKSINQNLCAQVFSHAVGFSAA